MKYKWEIRKLSKQFFEHYANLSFPEIEYKEKRGYNCILIEFDEPNHTYICIPYRSNINHKHAFFFKNSKRSKLCKSGLDFSKLVIIQNEKYIGSKTIIDADEYVETCQNMSKIVKKVTKYINDYISYVSNSPTKISDKKFTYNYCMSTLKYFHNELGIE